MPVLKMLRTCLLVGAGLLFFNISFGQSVQEENKQIIRKTDKILREAEKELSENDFASAEASYRQAVSKNPESVTARYNMANMYYGKEKPAQAATRYDQASKIAGTKEEKHRIFHNMGNSFMEQKNYAGAVEAYKNALRNIPSDEETRYNLALAKKMLEKEKEDGGGGEDDKKEQNKDDKNKDKKDDQGKKDQDKKDGEDKEDKGGDPKDDAKQEPEKPDDKGDPKDKKEEKGDQEKEQQPQPQPGQLSAQQIKNLLEAMNNEEKKVQEKINAQKAKGAKTRTGKDW
ncbi:MAG TPA: tetratricopeptide repeat protein [Gillisia sp.]|nr:tetratricopeptide repeat protein [Gillisia sp.]